MHTDIQEVINFPSRKEHPFLFHDFRGQMLLNFSKRQTHSNVSAKIRHCLASSYLGLWGACVETMGKAIYYEVSIHINLSSSNPRCYTSKNEEALS